MKMSDEYINDQLNTAQKFIGAEICSYEGYLQNRGYPI